MVMTMDEAIAERVDIAGTEVGEVIAVGTMEIVAVQLLAVLPQTVSWKRRAERRSAKSVPLQVAEWTVRLRRAGQHVLIVIVAVIALKRAGARVTASSADRADWRVLKRVVPTGLKGGQKGAQRPA